MFVPALISPFSSVFPFAYAGALAWRTGPRWEATRAPASVRRRVGEADCSSAFAPSRRKTTRAPALPSSATGAATPEKIIVELKAVSELNGSHGALVYNNLKATQMRLGMSINFGHYPGVGMERIIL
ncbi:TPA: hypothetical protein DDW35_08760 [Candidatus Sumerlaeota bacterium]|nr:hypothetical protein [Candidatus Sumerlaeota bacterium]